MSSTHVRGFAANRETLLFLAWVAGRSNIEDLKTCHARGKEPHVVLPAQLLYSMPPVFELDSYGPIYQALFLHRMAQVEWTFIDWAMRGFRAVYLAEVASSGEASPEATEETDILWEAINQQEHARHALRRMKEVWREAPNDLAEHVRVHFETRMPLLMRSIESAFLVQEYLLMSLERVNWRCIAARLLDIPLEQMPPARKPEEEQSGWPPLQFALLQESLRSEERTLGDFGSDYWQSQEVSDLCLDLAGRCLDARRELAQLQEQGKIYAPDRSASKTKETPAC